MNTTNPDCKIWGCLSVYIIFITTGQECMRKMSRISGDVKIKGLRSLAVIIYNSLSRITYLPPYKSALHRISSNTSIYAIPN